MLDNTDRSQPIRICIFVNVDWFVLSHFTDYIIEIVNKNYDLTILTLNTGRCSELTELGVKVKEVNIQRGYSSIFSELKAIISVFKAIREVSPDVLELITIKPVLYGGLISYFLRIRTVIFYMSGLGSMFTSKTFFGKIKSVIILSFYKLIMQSSNSKIIVENDDDFEMFKVKVGMAPKQIYQISGVGVDLKKFSPSSGNAKTYIRVAMASRLLYDKGIIEYFLAAKICKEKFPDTIFYLAGSGDPTNPENVSDSSIATLCDSHSVDALGHIADMANFLKKIDIFVLPSYREGFPRAIMEASATGLPTVTTDVVGCRSAVLDRITGIVVPAQNSKLLADAIMELIVSPDLREKLSKNARHHAEKEFDVNTLTHKHMSVWEKATGTALLTV